MNKDRELRGVIHSLQTVLVNGDTTWLAHTQANILNLFFNNQFTLVKILFQLPWNVKNPICLQQTGFLTAYLHVEMDMRHSYRERD